MDKRRETIRDIREFNRFYTNILGLLDRHILDTGYSLTQARILFELNESGRCIANDLSVRLRLDKSYLSRILAGFIKDGLVQREASGDDGRAHTIALTETGREKFRQLNEKSNQQMRQMLFLLSDADCDAVRTAMATIRRHLSAAQTVAIRPYTPSDIGFVTDNQIKLYEKEYQFTTAAWKAYVTEAVRQFADRFDETRDCMVMLEYRGVLSGCIAIAHAQGETAQLRFFFLEERARGLGIGGKLIELALAFCKEKRYRHVFLLTCSKLDAARYLYRKHGFHITSAQQNDDWGEAMTEERWDLDLEE